MRSFDDSRLEVELGERSFLEQGEPVRQHRELGTPAQGKRSRPVKGHWMTVGDGESRVTEKRVTVEE